MVEFVDPRLAAWQNYYVIIGSAAAALIGIQFVVLALIANMRALATPESIHAFGTPTVVHLGSVLLLSAIVCAPWPSLFSASVGLAMCGLGGLAYGAVVIHRARRQTTYKPVGEDWLWHAVFPCSAYVALALAAALLRATTRLALFVIGGVALGLLFVGIHNAWDTVTYVVGRAPRREAAKTE